MERTDGTGKRLWDSGAVERDIIQGYPFKHPSLPVTDGRGASNESRARFHGLPFFVAVEIEARAKQAKAKKASVEGLRKTHTP